MGGGSFLQKNCYSEIFCRFQNFGENTGEKRVSFFKILVQTRAKNVYLLLVGWLDGWMVGCLFFLHTLISELNVYPSYARTSHRSARNKNNCSLKRIVFLKHKTAIIVKILYPSRTLIASKIWMEKNTEKWIILTTLVA